MEYIRRCRICLNDSADRYFDIFDNCKSSFTYADNIRHIAEVDIQQNDGLTQKICCNCAEEIRNIFEFGLLIRHGDEVLRKELLEQQKEEIIQVAEDENIQILDDEDCFITEDVGDGGEGLSVLEGEEVLTVDDELVEEYGSHHDEGHYQIIEEDIFEVVEDTLDSSNQLEPGSKESKETNGHLEELAQVASTQQNVLLIKGQTHEDYYSEDECDDDYLIPYNATEEAYYNFKPPKWKCIECKSVLRGDVSYEGHMNIHKQLHPHKCPQCRRQFRCRNALKKHKARRHNTQQQANSNQPNQMPQNATDDHTGSYKCPDCNEVFESDGEFLFHELSLTHGNRCHLTFCPFCPNGGGDGSGNLMEHLQSSHIHTEQQKQRVEAVTDSDLAFQCESCSHLYKTIDELHDHQDQCNLSATEEQEINIDDDQCEESMLESIDMIVHCEVCNRKVLKRNIKRHMLGHERKDKKSKEDSNTLLCAYCPEIFSHHDDLNLHFRLIHYDTPFDNHDTNEYYDIFHEYIEESYILRGDNHHTKADIDDGRRIKPHAEAPKYICPICGNIFSGHAQLSAHKRLHKERPYKCTLCTKSYPRRVELEIHMRSHTGEMPYVCHLCNKRFAIKVRLTYHLQKHEGIKHTCPYCNAVYDNRNKLKAHLFKHTGMPYRCEICPGVGFDRRIRFANHMQRIHQRILTDDELADIFAKNTGKTIRFKAT
ncbi:uncharacterized protein isoform X1 [Musca autumnalis]|uniref:uncharacterized protein isoform X1 n=1 Tax=Musca autumnalis TaxID=221902 RepID=UPI003CF659CC